MKKNLKLILNTIAYFCFCLQAGTGLLMEFRIADDPGATILNMAKEDWAEIHEWAGFVFIGLVALHLLLNWPWLKQLAAGHFWKVVLGLAAGVCIIVGLLLLPMSR